MLVALIAALSLQSSAITIRDSYGIPHIFADSARDAFEAAGYAVAEDRLWQLELSRRSARGMLSEILGPSAVASDKEVIQFGYTSEEYMRMYEQLSPEAKLILEAYSDGINRRIEELYAAGKLPNGFGRERPRRWGFVDSMAITVGLTRLFGAGGDGEIRNLLLYTYLKDRLKDKTPEAIEDILWQNDPAATPTVSKADDPFKGKSPFPKPDAGVLRKHLALLPKVNLLELLPAIRLEERADTRDLAASLGIPNRWGSYAIVVGKDRSAIGVPLLLNGPQMGFSLPSVVHQISISCPEYTAVGMDVPGVPGIQVGHSPHAAWGLTSGVSDGRDIFFVKLNPNDPSEYDLDGKWTKFVVSETQIAVKGGDTVTAKREMTSFGPVIIKSVNTGVAYVEKSTLWKQESESFGHTFRLAGAKTLPEFQAIAKQIVPAFNLFVATTGGDIAWFYCGRVPIRSAKVDPRFPAPAGSEYDWTGALSADLMPFVENPKSGLIVNWNNKPVSWWPNMDTPLWGRIFRNKSILSLLDPIKKISPQNLELAARGIATLDQNYTYFLKDFLTALDQEELSSEEKQAKQYLDNWDGDRLDGSVPPIIFDAWFDAFRKELFSPKLGSLMGQETFNLVVQPTLTWNAMHRSTKIDYLDGRDIREIERKAFHDAVASLSKKMGPKVAEWRMKATAIHFNGMTDALYRDRGTYIQNVALWKTPSGRFVAPPGVSENPDSPFYSNQQALAANWAYCPMLWTRAQLPSN